MQAPHRQTLPQPSSGTSTRTRIETTPSISLPQFFRLRAEHPREQGLKPYLFRAIFTSDLLRAEHPREQGLKPGRPHSQDIAICPLRAEHPREQGLKLHGPSVVTAIFIVPSSGTSTRTRIETLVPCLPQVQPFDVFERNIHENKD